VRIVLSLVKRNLRIYRRDRAGVLLSLLAALMLLLIYALFLGAIQADSLKAKLPSAASEDVGYFVTSWVFGGIVMITCVTTGLGALGAYVDDRATGRFKEFRVCPIRRHQLILGYQLSAVVVSFVMTLIVSAVGAAVVKLVYGDIPGWGSFLTALGYVVLFAFAFSAISSFVAPSNTGVAVNEPAGTSYRSSGRVSSSLALAGSFTSTFQPAAANQPR